MKKSQSDQVIYGKNGQTANSILGIQKKYYVIVYVDHDIGYIIYYLVIIREPRYERSSYFIFIFAYQMSS